MLPATYLNIDVLVAVFVKTRHGSFVSDPEIDGVRFVFESNTTECDVLGDVLKNVCIFVTKIIIF